MKKTIKENHDKAEKKGTSIGKEAKKLQKVTEKNIKYHVYDFVAVSTGGWEGLPAQDGEGYAATEEEILKKFGFFFLKLLM